MHYDVKYKYSIKSLFTFSEVACVRGLAHREDCLYEDSHTALRRVNATNLALYIS